MKRTAINLMIGAFIIISTDAYAQGGSKKTAAKQIGTTSEKTDQLQGKKIQQQSLLNSKFEVLDSTAKVTPVRKKPRKKAAGH